MIPVHDLFESHLNVADLQRSMSFFGQTLGLELAQTGAGAGIESCLCAERFEGFSLEQTAEALGLSVSAVKVRSFRARLQLPERLSRYFRKTEKMPRSKLAPLV